MSWQGWQSWTDNGNKLVEREWVNAVRQEEDGWQMLVRKERRPGPVEVIIHGHAEPVFQEETRDAREQTNEGLVFNFEGKRCCALAGRLVSDPRSEKVQRCGQKDTRKQANRCAKRYGQILPYKTCAQQLVHLWKSREARERGERVNTTQSMGRPEQLHSL